MTTDKEVLHTQGELPQELTLLVTGTGNRGNEKDTELLYRTDDATLHLGSNRFTLLPHALIDRYNDYQRLLDSNKELLEALKLAFASLKEIAPQAMKYGSLQPIIETAINNAKNLNK